jgi:hypothetical protein
VVAFIQSGRLVGGGAAIVSSGEALDDDSQSGTLGSDGCGDSQSGKVEVDGPAAGGGVVAVGRLIMVSSAALGLSQSGNEGCAGSAGCESDIQSGRVGSAGCSGSAVPESSQEGNEGSG